MGRQMNARQLALVSSAIALFIFMSLIVKPVTELLGPLWGYLAVFALYWLCFCLPVALLFGHGSRTVAIGLSKDSPSWVPVTAFALPLIIAIAGGLLALDNIPTLLLVLALLMAAINGPLEELAWRRSFRANSNGRLGFEILGLVLFASWHVPLLQSHGVNFAGGAIGLVGGAALLGAIWTFMVRQTNAIGWAIVCHTLVNAAAFIPHFSDNFSKLA